MSIIVLGERQSTSDRTGFGAVQPVTFRTGFGACTPVTFAVAGFSRKVCSTSFSASSIPRRPSDVSRGEAASCGKSVRTLLDVPSGIGQRRLQEHAVHLRRDPSTATGNRRRPEFPAVSRAPTSEPRHDRHHPDGGTRQCRRSRKPPSGPEIGRAHV